MPAARDPEMNAVLALHTNLGKRSLELAAEVGGMMLVLGQTLRQLARGRCDRDELLRASASFVVDSLPIIAATGAFVGMIMVLQAASYVRDFGVYDLVGWYTGFATVREFGPVLIALMFSGRVGASNTSELATMKVSEQLDALRVLALDVYELLIVPRALAIVFGLAALVLCGDLVALVSRGVCAWFFLDISATQFTASLIAHLTLEDLSISLLKALVFGGSIAIISAHFGISARGGSSGVGRAVNMQVVACATTLFILDYFMSSVIR